MGLLKKLPAIERRNPAAMAAFVGVNLPFQFSASITVQSVDDFASNQESTGTLQHPVVMGSIVFKLSPAFRLLPHLLILSDH